MRAIPNKGAIMIDLFFFGRGGDDQLQLLLPRIETKKKIEGTVYEDTYKEDEQQRQRATKPALCVKAA